MSILTATVFGSPTERAEHETRVAAEVEYERVKREARRRLDAEERGPVSSPEILTLQNWLTQPDDALSWRIDGWQPADSRVILAAPYKAGKTTCRDNLIRTLVDGDPWLGRYDVRPITGTIAVLDTEMSRRQLRHWLRDQQIQHGERVLIIPLRGQAAGLDLLDADVRARWASWLRDRDVSYVILDCLRSVLDALGLDEHHDVGRFLVAFDALLREAGITEALIVHHMGHVAERSRGDSRLRDWPDSEWRVVRQDEDPSSPRFISAFGRDVDVRESRLIYDPTTRRLTIAGGSRRDEIVRQALEDVLAVLAAAETPLSRRAIEKGCEEAGSVHGRDRIREAVASGIRSGVILTEPGPRNATLHRSSARVRGSARAKCGTTPSERADPYRGSRTPRGGHQCAAVRPPRGVRPAGGW